MATLRVFFFRVLAIRSDKGLTLETSALKLLTVANLRYQLSCYYYIILLYSPQTQHHSFFRNIPPLHIFILSIYLLHKVRNKARGFKLQHLIISLC